MLVFPKAKINLGLNITGRRPDGYHNIETVFYPVNLCDALEMVVRRERADKDVLELTGYELPGKPEENIILRAAEMLRKKFQIPYLNIHLHKSIPAGAGLGGGSSDAACMLRAINRICNLSLSTYELKTLATSLGSDSPFFIDCRPSLASGRGEILKPVSLFLNGLFIVLVNPGILISTKEAYDSCVPAIPERSLNDTIKKPVSDWKDLMINDFEKTIFLKHPGLKKIKQELYDSGAVYSSMSGSGSTVYGIFNEKPVISEDLRNIVIYTGEL
jgi:4-diphosphocytidyl-2-C-methyl-D-erythritol kinase